MPETLYEIRGLTKKYGSRVILDGLDFDIHKGECLVILGRSGTGKSVTLRQLNGLEKPEAGTRRLRRHGPRRRSTSASSSRSAGASPCCSRAARCSTR